MDEKVLEEIQFHQETLSRDANSPLHLIREKEMEISGRVLSAKKQAEDIVAEARKKATTTLAKAEEASKTLAHEQEKRVLEELEKETAQIKIDAGAEIDGLRSTVADRQASAVDFVVKTVTEV